MTYKIATLCVSLIMTGSAVLMTSAFATDTKSDETKSTYSKTQQKTHPRKVGSYALNRFNKLDANKDGRISKTEFTNAHAMAFDKKDKNKDGYLSKAEASPTLAKQLKTKGN